MTEVILGPHQHINIYFTLSPCSSLTVRGHVSHPHKTTGKIIFQYILKFVFLDSKQETKKILDRMVAGIPTLQSTLNVSCMQIFICVIPKHLTFATI
jgi:hypothetical protein